MISFWISVFPEDLFIIAHCHCLCRGSLAEISLIKKGTTRTQECLSQYFQQNFCDSHVYNIIGNFSKIQISICVYIIEYTKIINCGLA